MEFNRSKLAANRDHISQQRISEKREISEEIQMVLLYGSDRAEERSCSLILLFHSSRANPP